MTKTELIKNVAEATSLSQGNVTEVYDAIFAAIKGALLNEGVYIVKEFGTFKVAKTSERKGVNPHTRQMMTIPAKKVVKFRPSPNLNKGIK